MITIPLHRPVASHPDLDRLHLFAGRHLGEDEFDQRQNYAEARLAPLLATQYPGVIHGLNLQARERSGLARDLNLVVTPGTGITPKGASVALQSPLRCSWQDLLDEFFSRRATNDPTGVYYLTLHQSQNSIDPPNADPCQRTAFDPTRDTQLVALSSLRLRKIILPAGYSHTDQPHKLQNLVSADSIDKDFGEDYPDSVMLGLVAFDDSADGPRLLWASEAAGRVESRKYSGYFTLLNQTQEALRELMFMRQQGSFAAQSLRDFLASNLHLQYLPAAGQLPLPWLENIAANPPTMNGLPAHIGVDMIPVAEDALQELLLRHLPRRVIDLSQPAGDRMRLLLSMKRDVYRPDILDIPATDSQLETDIFNFCKTAYIRWLNWKETFNSLYFVVPEYTSAYGNTLSSEDESALRLPLPSSAPMLPNVLFSRLDNAARKRLELSAADALPYPYSEADPTAPASFTAWAPYSQGVYHPPLLPAPDNHGLIPEYALVEKDLDTLEDTIRDLRTKVERTRDVLLLQRQQLDSQTVSLASLAGGVAGDGKGLQVARWLPYASLNTDAVPGETSTRVTTTANTAATTTQSVKVATDSTAESTYNYRLADYQTVDKSLLEKIALQDAEFTEATRTTYLKEPILTTASPDKYSAFELSLNQDRINRLQIPTAAVSKPAFNAKEFSFGVLDHISPDVSEYNKAYTGMSDLLKTIDDLFPDAVENADIRRALKGTSNPTDTALSDSEVLNLKTPSVIISDAKAAAIQHLQQLQTDADAAVAAGEP
ncbi:MAG: hypothetical protein VW258_03585, partial [Thalassolituus sp.]